MLGQTSRYLFDVSLNSPGSWNRVGRYPFGANQMDAHECR
jgi:hypothetical protein